MNFSGRTIYSFDTYTQEQSWAAGVSTFSGTITTQMASDYYNALWAATGRSLKDVTESSKRSGFQVQYSDYSNVPNEVIVGTMFVSTAKMREHLGAAEAMSGWDKANLLMGGAGTGL